jgi:hypothetical protein
MRSAPAWRCTPFHDALGMPVTQLEASSSCCLSVLPHLELGFCRTQLVHQLQQVGRLCRLGTMCGERLLQPDARLGVRRHLVLVLHPQHRAGRLQVTKLQSGASRYAAL